MGRRRRHRHGAAELRNRLDTVMADIEMADTLSPTFVSVPSGAWTAPTDFPVLALDGLAPDTLIAGPVLMLDDPNALPEFLRDSTDPSQLELSAVAVLELEEVEVAPVTRPVLVLEPEPSFEVKAQIELLLSDGDEPGVATLVEPELPFDDAAPAADLIVVPAPVIAESLPEIVAEPEPEPVVDPMDLRCDEARTATGEGRIVDAKSIYREIIVERPSHLEARNALALLLERQGDNNNALLEYDKALEIDGSHTALLANRGALLGAMGRYAAAERDLKKVLRTEPAHLEALLQLGVVMTRKGLWAEAIPQLRRAVEIDPARGPAYFYLGEALNKVDDLYGAMAAYQRAAELMPEHPRALYGLGIVYDRLGRPDDAARMYRRSREVGRR